MFGGVGPPLRPEPLPPPPGDHHGLSPFPKLSLLAMPMYIMFLE